MKNLFFKLILFFFISQISFSMTNVPSIFKQLQFLKDIEDENIESIKKFLDNGYAPDFEIEGIGKSNPIIKSINIGNIELIELLFAFLADDINKEKLDHYLSLCLNNIKSRKSKKDVVLSKFLIERGASVNFTKLMENSLLQEIIRFGDIDYIKYLIEKGANIYHIGHGSKTVLEIGFLSKNMEIIKTLFFYGCRINKIYPILMILVKDLLSKNDFDSFNLLLNNMTSDEVRKNFFIKLLIQNKNFELILELMNKYQLFKDNFDFINHKDENDQNILILAVKEQNVDLVKYLINNGADVSLKDKTGKNAFDYVCNIYNINEELIKIILDNFPSKEYGSNGTLLLRAISIKNINIVEFLLNKGFDVNIKDFTGETAIFQCFSFDLMNLILEKKPDLKIVNKIGHDIFTHICQNHFDLLKEIKSYIHLNPFINSFYNKLILKKISSPYQKYISFYSLNLLNNYLSLGFNPYYKDEDNKNFLDYIEENKTSKKLSNCT